MDAIRAILIKKLANKHANHGLLRSTLQNLTDLQRLIESGGSSDMTKSLTNNLTAQCEALKSQEIWEKEGEEKEALDRLAQILMSLPSSPGASSSQTPNEGQPPVASNISIVNPPSQDILGHTPWHNAISLPVEIIDQLNEIHFLHVLATSPQKVLPPGKSVLSMMYRPDAQPPDVPGSTPSLQDKLGQIVRKAFWDEALETLSEPTPSKQLPRLKLLYSDLHESLVSLLPPSHPSLITLSSPLSPTPAPLVSALRHLRELLLALKMRSAPVRDDDIDALIEGTNHSLHPSATKELAKVVVDSIRAILQLAEDMKSDMTRFILGQLSEDELNAEVIRQAKERERSVILDLWGKDVIQNSWAQWLGELSGSGKEIDTSVQWIERLIQALGTNSPVACVLLDNSVSYPASLRQRAVSETNALPPPFLFICQDLLRIQNGLQALVIAAALRSLVSRPSQSSISSSNAPSDQLHTQAEEAKFTGRIWTLLKIELDGEDEGSGTKLVNLADEVIREYRSHLGVAQIDGDAIVHEGEEKRLRDAVERILKPQDPVFLLLQKRILGAISSRLSSPLTMAVPMIPKVMQTGRERKRLRLETTGAQAEASVVRPFGNLDVKGFEDPVLLQGANDELRDIAGIIAWVRDIWGSTLGISL